MTTGLRIGIAAVVSLAAAAGVSSTFAQGSLTPPGPPEPTMKTLAQIEPRIPITNIPYTAAASGSYYLTATLTGVTGITIATNHVTIDLCGFTLTGPGKSAGGAASGIGGSYANVVVRNGRIREWPGHGVVVGSVGWLEDLNVENCNADGLQADQQSRAVNCRVGNCGENGIRLDHSSRVQGCTAVANASNGVYTVNDCEIRDTEATYNTVDGIATGNGCSVIHCVAANNTRRGMTLSNGNTVIGCTAYNNTGDGISASSGCTVNDCTAYNNTGSGIATASRCTVAHCTAYDNGRWGIAVNTACTISRCTATENGTNILVTAKCSVIENTCSGTGLGSDVGIQVYRTGGTGNRLDGNTVSWLAVGIDVRDSGNLIIRNTAYGNTVDYSITNNNSVGIIVVAPGTGFTNSNPWSNFEF
jgi:parallel beta-helix repeat protein